MEGDTDIDLSVTLIVPATMWNGVFDHAIFLPWTNKKAAESEVLQVTSVITRTQLVPQSCFTLPNI